MDFVLGSEQMQRFIEGMRKIQKKGIPVLFDGLAEPESDWELLFRKSSREGFYRCDYHVEEDGSLREISYTWVGHENPE